MVQSVSKVARHHFEVWNHVERNQTATNLQLINSVEASSCQYQLYAFIQLLEKIITSILMMESNHLHHVSVCVDVIGLGYSATDPRAISCLNKNFSQYICTLHCWAAGHRRD